MPPTLLGDAVRVTFHSQDWNSMHWEMRVNWLELAGFMVFVNRDFLYIDVEKGELLETLREMAKEGRQLPLCAFQNLGQGEDSLDDVPVGSEDIDLALQAFDPDFFKWPDVRFQIEEPGLPCIGEMPSKEFADWLHHEVQTVPFNPYGVHKVKESFPQLFRGYAWKGQWELAFCSLVRAMETVYKQLVP